MTYIVTATFPQTKDPLCIYTP